MFSFVSDFLFNVNTLKSNYKQKHNVIYETSDKTACGEFCYFMRVLLLVIY